MLISAIDMSNKPKKFSTVETITEDRMALSLEDNVDFYKISVCIIFCRCILVVHYRLYQTSSVKDQMKRIRLSIIFKQKEREREREKAGWYSFFKRKKSVTFCFFNWRRYALAESEQRR